MKLIHQWFLMLFMRMWRCCKKCISLWVSSIYAKNIAYGKFMKQVSNLQVCVTFQHCGTLNSIKWWDPMCIAHHWRLVKELHWKGLGFCRVQSVVIRMNRVWFYASCICNSAIDAGQLKLKSIWPKKKRIKKAKKNQISNKVRLSYSTLMSQH